MEQRNHQRRAETSEHQSLVLLMSRFVDPLEEADHKTDRCYDQSDGEVDGGDI